MRVTDANTRVKIRAEEVADQDAIAAVVSRAFESSNEARLVAAIRASSNYVPSWSLVAVTTAGRVVGYVMVSYINLRDGATKHRVPSLSPLSVDPNYQRRGVGCALARAVASAVESAGEPLIVLEGSPAYYSRLGFEYAVPLGITIKLPDWAPPEAAQVLRLSRYDAGVRGEVEYPRAFNMAAE
jgi:putative acetyltransferase